MGSETAAPIELPKIDFSGIEPAIQGTEAWAVVRSQVMGAFATYGCFEAVYPKVSPELRNSLLDTSMKELFTLPVDTKVKNVSDKPFHGYIGPNPYIPNYESLAVMDASNPEGVQSFTRTMWPDGNPNFCETVLDFSKKLAELDQMVMQMVLESLGVERFYRSIMDSSKYLLRVSEYQAPQADGEKQLGLIPHRDKNTTAIICQNQIDGLEMETKDGQWYPALPSPDSVIIIAGDSLQAWTNGRVYSPLHRILVGGCLTRYSTILFSVPNNDTVIQPLPEMVDAAHPPLFKPFDYASYVRFCYTEEGMKANPQLDAFCGLSKQQEA